MSQMCGDCKRAVRLTQKTRRKHGPLGGEGSFVAYDRVVGWECTLIVDRPTVAGPGQPACKKFEPGQPSSERVPQTPPPSGGRQG